MRTYRSSLSRTAAGMVGALLLAVALAPAALAADEDMALMAEHPIVGTWIADSSPEDPTNAVELSVYGPGGTIVNIGPEGNTAGSWVPTGERTADTMIQNPMSDPEGGSLGLIIVRGDATVSEDGQSFSGTWTVEFPAAMVEGAGLPAGQLGPGNVTAQRVNIEPMGEPVAPWPLPPPPEEVMAEEGASG